MLKFILNTCSYKPLVKYVYALLLITAATVLEAFPAFTCILQMLSKAYSPHFRHKRIHYYFKPT